MPWIYLLISLALFAGAYKSSGWLVVLLLFGSLIAFITWMLSWTAARIARGARSEMQIISPEDLKLMREQAAARKAAAETKSESSQP
jgi:hypothetical protein